MSVRLYPLLLVLLIVGGCEARKSAAELGAASSAPLDSGRATAAQPAAVPAIDTTAAAFRRLGEGLDSVAGLPAVRLDGQVYRIRTEAQIDCRHRLLPRRPFVWEGPDSAGRPTRTFDALRDSIYEAHGYGCDARYTVQLLAPGGGRPRFITTLRKTDFVAALELEPVAEALVVPPEFLGYLPQFHALAFAVPFNLDESDAGVAALVLLDASSGRRRYLTRYYFNSGGTGANALTPDGRTLLLCYEILRADAPPVSLLRPRQEVAGTVLINGQTALVVYTDGYDANTQQPLPIRGANAHLLDLSGRELAAFRFDGVSGALGYQLNHHYLPATRTHYLYDDTNNTLRLIPRGQPQQHRLLPLRQLPPFAPPRRRTEVRFEFDPESGKHLTLYADTLSGKLRYQLRQAAYD